jgi:hypothetical protein
LEFDECGVCGGDDDCVWFEDHVISNTADGVHSVYALDVDSDGYVDILSANVYDNKISWYKNDGDANFTEQIISTSSDEPQSVFSIDVDGDALSDENQCNIYTSFSSNDNWPYDWSGNCDDDEDGVINSNEVVGCQDDTACNYNADATDDDGSCYYPSGCDEICDSELEFDECGVCGGEHDCVWFEDHVISNTADGVHSVYALDVDSDGYVDILSANVYDNKISWYKNDGDANFTEQIISTSSDEPQSVFSIDVDGDALSDENQCNIYTSFSSNDNWPYDWSGNCDDDEDGVPAKRRFMSTMEEGSCYSTSTVVKPDDTSTQNVKEAEETDEKEMRNCSAGI